MTKKMGRPRKPKRNLSQGVCVTLYKDEIEYIEKIGDGNRSKGIRELVRMSRDGKSGN